LTGFTVFLANVQACYKVFVYMFIANTNVPLKFVSVLWINRV